MALANSGTYINRQQYERLQRHDLEKDLILMEA